MKPKPLARPKVGGKAPTLGALRDKVPRWWHPHDDLLQAVYVAADSFDDRQMKRQRRANDMRLASLTPRHKDTDFVASGEWTSPHADGARKSALFDCFVNRYIPPSAPAPPEESGMEWTRPDWWSTGRRPDKLGGIGDKFPSINDQLSAATKDMFARHGAVDPNAGGKKRGDGPSLGASRVVHGSGGVPDGGVTASVRTSLDEPGAPPSLSLKLDKRDKHSEVFNTLAQQLDSASAQVGKVVLRRLDPGYKGEEIVISADSLDQMVAWPKWAENGQFELFVTMTAGATLAVFNSLAAELDTDKARVNKVTLRRLDGDHEEIVLSVDAADTLGGWPEWALDGQFELFCEMGSAGEPEEKEITVGGAKRGGGREKRRGDGDGNGSSSPVEELSELEQLLVDDALAQEAAIEAAIERGDREWIGDIWKGRVDDSASGDYFDNEQVYKKRFDREWDDQKELFGSMSPALCAESEYGDMMAVMWDCDDMLTLIFDYYASLGSDGRISSMTFNEWGMFLEDFHLPDPKSQFCNRSDLDRVFIAVDTKASHLAKEAAEKAAALGHKAGPDTDEKKALTRVEFLTAVIQVAMNKFVKTKKIPAIAEALHTLLVDVVDPLINWDLLPDPNLFRRSCYVGEVSEELARHADSLKTLHSALCEVEFGAYAKRMGSKTWIRFMRAVNFMIGIDLSERDCNLCFVWARMAVSGQPNVMSDALPFEGFLEALCRVASIKALPSDDEINEHGCDDAGHWVLYMNSDDDLREEYNLMLVEREIGWGGTPPQPLDRCVAHTLSIILQAIDHIIYKGVIDKPESNGLSFAEVARFVDLCL